MSKREVGNTILAAGVIGALGYTGYLAATEPIENMGPFIPVTIALMVATLAASLLKYDFAAWVFLAGSLLVSMVGYWSAGFLVFFWLPMELGKLIISSADKDKSGPSVVES